MVWPLDIGRPAGSSLRPGSPGRRLPRSLIRLAVLLAMGLVPPAVQAGSGMLISLPQPATKPKSGLRLNIDTRWVDANGYRPVRVEAIQWPPGPAAADRSFRIVLRAQSYAYGARLQTVTQYLELPQGAARAAMTVAMPQHMIWNSLSVAVYEDGRRLEDVSTTVGIPLRNYYWTESAPAMLFIDSDVPPRDRLQQQLLSGRFSQPGGGVPRTLLDLRYVATCFPSDGNANAPFAGSDGEISDQETLVMLQSLSRLEMLAPGELPDRWIDFSCFDLIWISRSDLQQLVEQQPATWAALRDWLATGPSLCVYGVPIESAELADLDRLLNLPPGELGAGGGAEPGWRLPRPSYALGGLRGLQSTVPAEAWEKAEPVELPSGDPAAAPFAIRQVELGRVAAIASDDPLGGERSRDTDWLFNELDSSNWMWFERHGMSLHRENADFWNLVVPGVGRAPVGAYLVLITLFVVVIGPLNYYWLSRSRRLYLLLVTVPAGAALLTLALLNYALITDGLGVRVRARSYTHLDQRSQRAVSWSRQSYYAGLAPSGGMNYPAAAAVYPLEQHPADYRRQRGHDRRLLWNDSQRLQGGYLTARSTTQFLVVHTGSSERRLVIGEPAGGGAPTVENQLGTDVMRLVLRDSAGRLFQAGELSAGGSTVLQPGQGEAAFDELKQLYNAARPQFPEGYDSGYYNRAFGFRRYAYWMNVDSSSTPPSLEQGLLERYLRGSIWNGVAELPTRGYLAVTRSGVETPLGYSELTQTGGFHLVRGTW